jgi:hypothetical protein
MRFLLELSNLGLSSHPRPPGALEFTSDRSGAALYLRPLEIDGIFVGNTMLGDPELESRGRFVGHPSAKFFQPVFGE